VFVANFLKKWIDARINQQYFVPKKIECLEHEMNSHIKVITKLNETNYEMSCTAATRGRQKLAFEESSEKIKRRRSKEL
jgi:hypothetical protein